MGVAGPRRSRFGLVVCLAVTATLTACGDDGESAQEAQSPAEPTAGEWHTWVLSSPVDIVVPPPPPPGSDKAESDLDEVKRLADERNPQVRDVVNRWNGGLPTKPWTETAYDFVSKSAKNPPLSSRNYALLHVAMSDAVVASYYWKYAYNVEAPKGVSTLVPASPDPSYPSEHAAMAGAASKVLAHLYPNQPALRLEEMAEDAAMSRVQAGTNTPSDVAAGLELGRAVGDAVIAYAKADGADKPDPQTRPPGIGRGPAFWEPPPGSPSPPTAPAAATWKPWVMTSPDQFRPPPPPAYGSAEFRAAAQEIVDIKNNLTPEQERIARFWEGQEGTSLPAGIALRVASEDLERAATTGEPGQRMSIPRTTRALALINIAMADAGIAAWDGKYAYWNPRPENAIRDLGLDPNWKPLLGTPRFPAYPSGSAGYAGATEVVMTYLFPEKAAEFKRRALEQADSRLYAGIHWRYDAVSLDAGRQIANLVIERAKKDGADA